MTQQKEIYERTMKMLGPALERVAGDPEFRDRLEANPLAALAEMNVVLDAATRQELEGKRFSEFWAQRRKAAETPVEVRELPPQDGQLSDEQLSEVTGGLQSAQLLSPTKTTLTEPKLSVGAFAPPYVPVGTIGDF